MTHNHYWLRQISYGIYELRIFKQHGSYFYPRCVPGYRPRSIRSDELLPLGQRSDKQSPNTSST